MLRFGTGNSCFTDPFFDPFFCQQFFFRNRFLFAQPVFLPYPVYTAPYSQVVEQPPSSIVDRGNDLKHIRKASSCRREYWALFAVAVDSESRYTHLVDFPLQRS
jgi:hypothetical protein